MRAGGTLWLTAGAATRDEYDRPLPAAIEDLLPARRAAAADTQPFHYSGRSLGVLKALDEVTFEGGVGGGGVEVLSVRQALDPKPGAQVLGRYRDGSSALVRSTAEKGTVYEAGFLPALAYVKSALTARAAAKARADAGAGDATGKELLARSANPWEFPAPVRDLILRPVRSAGVTPPVTCDVPRVDAVYMTCDRGVLVPLANYTLKPIDRLSLTVRTPRSVACAESSHHGKLDFKTNGDRVEVSLPLESTDFVKLYYADAPGGK